MSAIQVNVATIRLSGIKALTNSIRNGRSDISIKTAEALETISGNLQQVANAIGSINLTIPGVVVQPTTFAPLVLNAALAPLPSGWTANPNITNSESGDQAFEVSIKWEWPPVGTTETFGGITMVLDDGVTKKTLGSIGVGSTAQYTSTLMTFPPGTTNYTMWLVSYDAMGQSNPIVPGTTPNVTFSVTRNIGPAGTEYAADVLSDGVHPFVTAVPVAAADGTAMLEVTGYWTPPNDPQFGGAEVVIDKGDGLGPIWTVPGLAGRISPVQAFVPQPSTVQSWIFYLRSIDINGNRNTVVPATTPHVTISVGNTAGQLNLGKALNTSFSNEFQILAGALHINQLSANTIVTGQLQVGGGGNKVSEFKIFDALGLSLIGWIGDDTLNSGFVGGWMKQFRIGGANPASAPFVADSSGNVSMPASALTAGTITAAISVTAGTFTGSTLVLNLNGITTSINNAIFSPTGRAAGFNCASGSFECGVDYLGLFSINGSGGFAQIGVTTGGGGVSLESNSASNQNILIDTATGSARILINSVLVINSSGAFVGTGGVNCGRFAGIAGRAFNPYDAGGTLFTGQDWTIGFNPATSKLTVNGVDVNTLKFVGGSLVSDA